MVPLCFDKSTFPVIAMLAVLKAGGVCVSLGPSQPRNRLQHIVADTKASVVLTSSEHAHIFNLPHIQTIVVDEHLLASLPLQVQPARVDVDGQNAAFVVYTSGSTGLPKGVIISHSSVATSSEAHGSFMGIGPGSRVLNFAAWTFDLSIRDVFTTLQRGGCVCIISDYDRLNNLAGAVSRHYSWSSRIELTKTSD